MYILESFNDTWNYTFLIVTAVAILIGTLLTIRRNKKNTYTSRRERREKSGQQQ